MRPIIIVIAMAGALAGCSGGYYYERSSGLRADASPKVLAPFQRAKTECQGEIAQSRLAGSGLRDPMVEVSLSETAMHGCMSKRGYDVRP